MASIKTRLSVIRDHLCEHVKKSQTAMTLKANEKTKPLFLQKGYYVYQYQAKIRRLKRAYARAPQPNHYLRVIRTVEVGTGTQTEPVDISEDASGKSLNNNIGDSESDPSLQDYMTFTVDHAQFDESTLYNGVMDLRTIWLMPRDFHYGGWPKSGDIDIIESRGNTKAIINGVNQGINQLVSKLNWGPDYRHNAANKTTTYSMSERTAHSPVSFQDSHTPLRLT
ncbi:uncharacterized protein LOC117316963 [Pecten maximus]|uniref:uncharacterized protein LOC117316963 n=1 Tax=Pecten maximus TaxID=6579 RepID=UPI001459041C|nr:uncharacterized protein LOC117316963 [Pecten maximus]